MLVVADVNTLWRSLPFEALSKLRPLIGLKPMDPLIALQQGWIPLGTMRSSQNGTSVISVVLPFRWATGRAERALGKLWSVAVEECRSAGGVAPSALAVTSPHYAPLVEKLSREIPTFYYCSDDYTRYHGWDPTAMRDKEAAIVRDACHSFFVSAALRDRAQRDSGAPINKLSICMNATDEKFLAPVGQDGIEQLLRHHPRLKHPIVGVIGGIDQGLDFALLSKVSALEKLGTLLLVGPIDNSRDKELVKLLKNERVVCVGFQPHMTLPVWLQTLDVAFIPYQKSKFNYFRSPMRLFDHLASGRPIVATSACPQVLEFSGLVEIGLDDDDVLGKLAAALASSPGRVRHSLLCREAERHTWPTRASFLDEVISRAILRPPAV